MKRVPTLIVLACAGAASAGVVAAPVFATRAYQSAPASQAMGKWTPSAGDTCLPAVHDRYSMVARDGKRYPTWHPPVVTDPDTGRACTFGHEHGRDPRGSALSAWLNKNIGGIPFGYANEQLDAWVAAGGASPARHEDHVGHKIEWQNGVALQRTVNGRRVRTGVTCDFLTKVHQGTHSKDALGNNTHELLYAVRCSDGTRIIATVLSTFGAPNTFTRSCDKTTVIPAGTNHALPAGRGGVRFIPDRACVERYVLVPDGQFSAFSQGLYEDWLSANYLRTGDGRQIAYFDPHFAVFNPARYARDGEAVATLTSCGEAEANGDRARGGECTVPSPSSFDGAHRETYFNQTSLANKGGPTTWWTDPYGNGASRTAFPGAIAQLVSATDNRSTWPTLESQAFGADRPYGGRGVHSPN